MRLAPTLSLMAVLSSLLALPSCTQPSTSDAQTPRFDIPAPTGGYDPEDQTLKRIRERSNLS